MKYAILTFGCRTNQADSFALDRDLRGRGGREADIESADLVVVNTCAVTATAEQAARQAIRRVARLNPKARIVATGCYATRAASDVASLPVSSVARRLDPGAPRDAVFHIAEDLDCRAAGEPGEPTAASAPMPGPGTLGRTLHLLNVQTGCDERCSYCIVPATRGPSRSVTTERAVEAVRAAAAAGFRQTTITGVHLGSYGRDLLPRVSLATLVRRLCGEIEGMLFRLSAVEPMDFDDDLIEAVRAGHVAPHFHLPLQHASDRILDAMARPYTLEQYRAVVQRLLRALPGAAIGSDLIAGFPGETDADFERCAAYLADSGLAYAHVFPFSPRPGTPAARLPDRPRGDVVRHRVRRLRAISAEINRRFRSRFVGATVKGLTLEDGTLVMTDNYLRVRIPAGLGRNERVSVRIVADGQPMAGVPA